MSLLKKPQITQIAQISTRGRIREIRVIRGFFQRGPLIESKSRNRRGPVAADSGWEGKRGYGHMIEFDQQHRLPAAELDNLCPCREEKTSYKKTPNQYTRREVIAIALCNLRLTYQYVDDQYSLVWVVNRCRASATRYSRPAYQYLPIQVSDTFRAKQVPAQAQMLQSALLKR